jgi:phage baseplate assembly protein W
MIKKPLPASLKKVVNRDFDLLFRAHPSTGKLLMKKDDDTVKQALKNLVLTNQYERPFRPNYGGNVRKRLFDLHTSVTKSDYENLIETAVKNYEPRALLDNNSINIIEHPDENSMVINIRFKNQTTLNDLQLDVNLNRIR